MDKKTRVLGFIKYLVMAAIMGGFGFVLLKYGQSGQSQGNSDIAIDAVINTLPALIVVTVGILLTVGISFLFGKPLIHKENEGESK